MYTYFIRLNEPDSTRRRIPITLRDDDKEVNARTGRTLATAFDGVSKNGAAFNPAAGSFVELSNGDYYYEFAPSEIDTPGYVVFRWDEATVKNRRWTAQIVGFDPYAGPWASQTSVDAANAAIATKASQTSVDSVASAVATKASQASVDMKASQSSVDGVAVSVATRSSQVSVDLVKAQTDQLVFSGGRVDAAIDPDTIWSWPARTLTSFGSLVDDIWNHARALLLDVAVSTRADSTAVTIEELNVSALTPAQEAQLFAVPSAVENADALLTRDWTQIAGEPARCALNAFRALRNKWTLGQGIQTVRKENNTDVAWTAVVAVDLADGSFSSTPDN